MLIGLVMVLFWWSSCLIIKVFCSYTHSFSKYQISIITPNEFTTVMEAIAYRGLCMLFKNCNHSSFLLHIFLNLVIHLLVKFVFELRAKKNYKIRSLFLKKLISVISFFYSFV